MLKITQGYSFTKEVPSEDCLMVLKSQTDKFVVDQTIQSSGKICLYAPSSVTSGWPATNYKYQILSNSGLFETGEMLVQLNYLMSDTSDDPRSQNEILLDAVQAQLAGKATSAQSSMTVGDKSISYCSIAELFQLREYFACKVAEEKKKRSPLNGGLIKYRWSSR